jgi:hypothetical protein
MVSRAMMAKLGMYSTLRIAYRISINRAMVGYIAGPPKIKDPVTPSLSFPHFRRVHGVFSFFALHVEHAVVTL